MTRLTTIALIAAGALASARPAAGQPKGLDPEALAARLARQTGEKLELTAREKDLLADAGDGKLSRLSLAEAALLACGARDDDARKAYLDRIDALEKDARQAVAGGKTPFDRGALLLNWMHAGPAKKYRLDVDDLTVLMDKGEFNCLSATTLYNTVGRRLGLDVRSMVGPTHICSIQYDGAEAREVETTNPAGYDPPGRRSKNRRQVDDPGLLAGIYRNHIARLTKAGRHPEAVRAAAFAQALDPVARKEDRDLEGTFHNWFVSDYNAGRPAEAAAVAAFGLEAVPENAKLSKDRAAACGKLAAGHRAKGEWDRGADVLTKAADGRADRELVREVEQHFLLWAQEHTRGAEWAKAAEVLEKGVAAAPGSSRLKAELGRVQKKAK